LASIGLQIYKLLPLSSPSLLIIRSLSLLLNPICSPGQSFNMKYSFTLAALAAVASGHTIFQQIVVGGTEYGVGVGIRKPSYNGPIEDVSTSYMACNGGPNPTTPSNVIIDVTAGSTVRAKWRHTDTNVIDASHKGPVMAYMKKVDNALTDSGVGGGWFKISEAGYNSATGRWAVDDLITANGYQDIPIPSCIANGQYLLRAEIVALHSAGNRGSAQFYMECAQINVSGGTGGSPSTVSIPGAYSATDPGILVNIYPVRPPYVIPGPRPYTCGGGSPQPTTTGSNPQPTTTSRTTLVTTTRTTTVAQPTTTPPATGGSPLYGQCGGNNWTGPTTCAQGRCVANGDWYSQCVP
jgi:cellulase